MFKNLSYKNIKSDAENFTLTSDDSYIESYPEFIRYFENVEKIEKHHLIIASHFVYGWMPTTLNLNTLELGRVLQLLNAAKNGDILTAQELLTLKTCVNNSLVGLSKLLHFINPNIYAIWDSRVFRYLTEKKSTSGIDKAEFYLEYLKGIDEIVTNIDFVNIHILIQSKFNYQIKPLRVVELIMFETDRRNSKLQNIQISNNSLQ